MQSDEIRTLNADIRQAIKYATVILVAKWVYIAFQYYGMGKNVYPHLIDVGILSLCLVGFHYKSRVASTIAVIFLAVNFLSNLIIQLLGKGSPSLIGVLISTGILLVIAQGGVATYKLKRAIRHNQAL